jgi:HD-GYP domain-containing protein (c-di-GMP phosphodiesterase class II)
MRSILALSRAIESRDPLSRGHSARATHHALAVLRRLDCSSRALQTVRLGGPVHDIGKLSIPDEVLLKPGPLDEDEQEIVRGHPTAGAKLLRALPTLVDAIACVLYHHERWDGGGYPLGLAGEDIPFEARALAVADAFDAMTTSRPYRRAVPEAAAIAELERCAGSQFDPRITAAFVEMWRDRERGADMPSGMLRAATL